MKMITGKIVPGKRRCHRCQEVRSPIRDCRFTFRESYAYWKALWQKRTGRRLTNRRKEKLAARERSVALKLLSDACFWMDLCDDCRKEVDRPWDGFPMEYWEQVLRTASAKTFVPTEMGKGASRT